MNEFQRVEVGYLDTPLEFLPNITKHFAKGNIYIKRDDMTGLAIGGNKTRKLDYIVKYALDNGYTTLLTYGGPQSNHARLTIAAAAKYGLKSILVTEGKKNKMADANLILDRMMDAEIVYIDNGQFNDESMQQHKKDIVAKIIQHKETNGEKVLDIPMGGSNALGTYGYFKCAKEIITQISQRNIHVDHVVCAYGSMGTFAGLWLGAKYYKADFDIIGIPVFPTPFALENCVKLINDLAKECDIDIRCTKADLNVVGGLVNNKYAGPAYAKSNKEIRDAMYLLARKEGIITDPCYTGKAVYGMFDLINKDVIGENENVLFLHTGGSPALFAKPFTDDIQEELWNDAVFQY